VLLLGLWLGPSVNSQPSTGVQGRVTDTLEGEPTNDPISDAEIRLYSIERMLETKSDKEGRFVFGSVPSGQYNLEAAAKGFQSQRIVVHVSLSSQKPVNVDIHMSAAPQPSVCNEPDISYGEPHSKRLGHIVCTVRDFSTKNPLPNVGVSLVPNQAISSKIKRTTNSEGQAEFDLAPGSYTLTAKRTGVADEKITVWVPRDNFTRISLRLPAPNELIACQ
jgi:Carboxypeptidase regulatory-like domain